MRGALGLLIIGRFHPLLPWEPRIYRALVLTICFYLIFHWYKNGQFTQTLEIL
jgi:hypothetical protein